MKENHHIVRNNIIMGGLYSCFGFLGLFLVFVTCWLLYRKLNPSEKDIMKRALTGDLK